MRKEASAKFTSCCAACGSTINPGEQITYDPAVKYSSRHKVCPSTVVKSKVPLNSPGRAALQGRGRSDFFTGEKSDIQLGWVERYKPSTFSSETIHAKDGRYLTCVGLAAHYVSQDEADDFDLIGTDGGFSAHWSVTRYYRLATDDEAAPVKARELEAQQKREAAARAKEELQQARKDFDVRLAELTAGLARVGCDYDLLAGDGQPPYVIAWQSGSDYKQLKETTSKITGQKAYVFPHGGYDDYRVDMFVDAETAAESFRRTRAMLRKSGCEQTPATAAAWLEKYRGCAGAEYYEWLAQQEN
jgi:hypothetical protein